MPEPLQPGDAYACPRCHTVHLVEQPYTDRTTAERFHLYVTCQGLKYFVGQVAACRRCTGARWICEQHPDRPWPHDACAGPGEPCPRCNRGARPEMGPGWSSLINA
jgi:hypothetical protein